MASLPPAPCRRSARRATSPTRNTGLNAIDGLWKIAAIRLPRSPMRTFSGRPTSSLPSSLMLPATVAPTVLASPSTASVVMDLPDPLSPARPTISASSTAEMVHVHDASDPEAHVQAGDLEPHRRITRLGSSRSRSPSPSRLNANAVIRMASPGNVTTHQSVVK